MIAARRLIGARALRRYDDYDDPKHSLRERLLLRMRWFDWVNPTELYDALDLGLGTKERDAAMTAMRRLIVDGVVERKGVADWTYGTRAKRRWYRTSTEPVPAVPPTGRRTGTSSSDRSALGRLLGGARPEPGRIWGWSRSDRQERAPRVHNALRANRSASPTSESNESRQPRSGVIGGDTPNGTQKQNLSR